MMKQVQAFNAEMNRKQEVMRDSILKQRQEEQAYKDEVLSLLREINDKLDVVETEEVLREIFYSLAD